MPSAAAIRPIRAPTLREVVRSALVSVPALMTPFIIIGGKVFGWFTATESACIAVLYAGALSIVRLPRDEHAKGLYGALLDTGKLAGDRAVLRRHRERFRLAARLLPDSEGAARRRASLGHGADDDRLLHRRRVPRGRLLPRRDPGDHHRRHDPAAAGAGRRLDPVHFAIIGIVSLAFGLVTPPYGLCLMIACAVAKIRMVDALKDTMIMLVPMLLVLAAMIVWPSIPLFLPRLFPPGTL